GTMGNFPSDYGSLCSLLTTGQLKAFAAQARAWSLASHDPIVLVLARSVLWFLPTAIRQHLALASFLETQARNRQKSDFVHVCSLDARLAEGHFPTLIAAVDQAIHSGTSRSPAILKGVYEYAMLRRLQSWWWIPEVVWGYPYADRRLVEFVTGIPFSVLCSP